MESNSGGVASLDIHGISFSDHPYYVSCDHRGGWLSSVIDATSDPCA